MKISPKSFDKIEDEILYLKKEKNAVILAHYYQHEEIQDIADFIGDSLDLSKKAQQTDADIIVFCGVRFMAEVAKILSPQKTVILPDINAGCSLEESCPPNLFKAFKKKYPDHIVLSYINCSAEIKALSDVIVTSSNAAKIINTFPKNKKMNPKTPKLVVIRTSLLIGISLSSTFIILETSTELKNIATKRDEPKTTDRVIGKKIMN